MILAIDVDYRDSTAYIAGIAFDSWQSEEASHVYQSCLGDISPYKTG